MGEHLERLRMSDDQRAKVEREVRKVAERQGHGEDWILAKVDEIAGPAGAVPVSTPEGGPTAA